ncbi:hypothetical protein EJV47_06965 [Hymenobacter gummosus]|uniref:Muconolactone isomerase domain-containing protein n=1 Tax=Hymenobacter gummosus TaxID=1776032 RepID=A0A3S0HAS4_9BACT|nr:hypothetical protein [Hymenobacter gummosus]RTQ51534.1 hypothetical protein EJV47_06965 [Hymenobacter gummosus]
MGLYVVTLRFPEAFDEEFVALIPRHRAFINNLIEENIILSYAISADRSRGWVTMYGASAESVQGVVEQFPLFRFLRQVEVDELFVFDSTATRLPKISLN